LKLFYQLDTGNSRLLILATQEAEIRRIAIRSQLRVNSYRDLAQKSHHKKKQKAGIVAQGEFKPVHQKERKKERNCSMKGGGGIMG
jgi:hypothetical protein